MFWTTVQLQLISFQVNLYQIYKVLKAAPWDDINFRFLFCNEVVYPTEHDFIFYGIFRFF